jgi:hypothetical protein
LIFDFRPVLRSGLLRREDWGFWIKFKEDFGGLLIGDLSPCRRTSYGIKGKIIHRGGAEIKLTKGFQIAQP